MQVAAVCESLSNSFAQESVAQLAKCIEMIVFGLIASGFSKGCHLLTSLLSTSVLGPLISNGSLFFHSIFCRNETFLGHLSERYFRKVPKDDFEHIFLTAIEAGTSYEILHKMIRYFIRAHNINES